MAARPMTRRTLVAGGMGGAAGLVVVAAGIDAGVLPGRTRLKDEYHALFGPHAHIPDAPEGQVRLEFVAELPRRPQMLAYGNGAHPRAYWDSVTLPASAFLCAALGETASAA
jgi:hypothetical protein